MASPFVLKASIIVGGISTVSGLASVGYISTWNTVADKLRKDGLDLISNDEDYKFVLFTHKDNADLKKAISQQAINYLEYTDNIKQWCGKQTTEWFSNNNLKLFNNVKAWCIVPKVKLLRDKLGNNIHKAGAWDTKFAEIAGNSKFETKFLEALNVVVVATDQKLTKVSKNVEDKFKKWCNSALDLKIFESDQYKTEENIQAWCLSN